MGRHICGDMCYRRVNHRTNQYECIPLKCMSESTAMVGFVWYEHYISIEDLIPFFLKKENKIYVFGNRNYRTPYMGIWTPWGRITYSEHDLKSIYYRYIIDYYK